MMQCIISFVKKWHKTGKIPILGKATDIPAHLLIKCWRRILYIVKLLSTVRCKVVKSDKSLTIYIILLQHFINRWAGITVGFPRQMFCLVWSHCSKIKICIASSFAVVSKVSLDFAGLGPSSPSFDTHTHTNTVSELYKRTVIWLTKTDI